MRVFNDVSNISLLLFLFSFSPSVIAQNESKNLPDRIENLFIQDSLQKAESLLLQQVDNAKTNNNLDQLSRLVYWMGKIEIESNEDDTFPETLELVTYIENNSADEGVRYQTYLDLSRLYGERGSMGKALEVAEKARQYVMQLSDDEKMADMLYYLGEYGLRSGNLNTFEENIRSALDILEENPREDFKISARILNYMGALMYLTAKPDSAYIYYNRALEKVAIMEQKSENQLYFPAAIKANMVLLKQSQNDYEEALALAQECISLNTKFIRTNKKHPLKFRAQRNLSLTYRNLASLYEQIGDYDKAHRIAQIAYTHAKKSFNPDLLEYFSAITLLAETKISRKEFDSAIEILDEAEKSLDAMDTENPLLRANLYTIIGGAYFGKKSYAQARDFYIKGNEYHEAAQSEGLSSDRLFSILNQAFSHAHLGEKQAAFELLEDVYRLQMRSSASSKRLTNALLIALARISDISEDYSNCLKWSTKFLKVNENNNSEATNALKAEAILFHVKARYSLEANKDIAFLKNLSKTLEGAIEILEHRKTVITTQDNVTDLIEDNREIFDFAKKISLELYNKTTEDVFLTKVISYHESSIYNRIRARLNLKEDISFNRVPEKIQQREKLLKEQLEKEDNSSIDTFLSDRDSWNSFVDSLRVMYPEYYKMRYATITEPLDQLQQDIPKNTTVIRYLFIEDALYALVADADQMELIPLNYQSDEERIIVFNDLKNNSEKIAAEAHDLYVALWKPLEQYIKTEKVIICPDRELFNLSFELLTPGKITAYKDFATQSLMAQHVISYNYSLLLLDRESKQVAYGSNFVAFAPEFTDIMKKKYELGITDSLSLDKTYLTLLPQPYSTELIKRYSRRFNGSSFLNEQASKQIFLQNAGEHKIIHIGTHAESNNVNPELSRLIFAKNTSDTTAVNDNFVYTYEIYNYDLASELAILTACETGKPSYQPGEGMISLAHAFNYAGSESILTSLWEIDEKSSNEIIASFYEYLADGLPKDLALRNAKLAYLKQAEGRTLHPQYWAGLVLMGDSSPISVSTGHSALWIGIFLGVLLVVLVLYVSFKRTKK